MIGWLSMGAAVAFLVLMGTQDPKRGVSLNMWIVCALSILLGYISCILFSILFVVLAISKTTKREALINKVWVIFYDKKFIEWEK